jgi:hypothetical protein
MVDIMYLAYLKGEVSANDKLNSLIILHVFYKIYKGQNLLKKKTYNK